MARRSKMVRIGASTLAMLRDDSGAESLGLGDGAWYVERMGKQRMTRGITVGRAGATLLACAGGAMGRQIIDLGLLPGMDESSAAGISADGTAVVGTNF